MSLNRGDKLLRKIAKQSPPPGKVSGGDIKGSVIPRIYWCQIELGSAGLMTRLTVNEPSRVGVMS